MSNIRGPQNQTPSLVPTLQQKESEKVQQQQVQNLNTEKVTAKDAQRAAQQAGFQRTQQQKKRFDIGDSQRAPIPLPETEIDEEAYEHGALDSAQENFTLAQGRLEESTQQATLGEQKMASLLLQNSLTPTDANVEHLQAISERKQSAVPMREVADHLKRYFSIPFGDQVPAGYKLLAVGLVVAGRAEAIQKHDKGLNEAQLFAGVQQVVNESSSAVNEAQRRSAGIQLERGHLRTYVPKR